MGEGSGAFDFDHFPTSVMPTIWADAMGQVFVTAVGANDQVSRSHGVMGSPTVTASLGCLSLWKRRHFSNSLLSAQERLPIGQAESL